MLKVLGIGDNVCDIYINSNEMYPGGQTLNFAVYAKQIGVKSAYIGVFGKDEISDHIIKTLDELEVEHIRCRQYEGENGYAVVRLEKGDRVFIKSNCGGIAKENPIILDYADKEYIKTFDLVHTSNNSYFDNQLKSVYGIGIPVSYDFSYEWEEWNNTINICPYIDFGFLSCGLLSVEETQNVCKKVYEMGCNIVIATMGSKGALLYNREIILFQKPKIVEAVDTLGAGDSFAAGFLINYMKEKKENADKLNKDTVYREKIFKQALDSASELAAKNCLVRGAFGHSAKIPDSIMKSIESLIQ